MGAFRGSVAFNSHMDGEEVACRAALQKLRERSQMLAERLGGLEGMFDSRIPPSDEEINQSFMQVLMDLSRLREDVPIRWDSYAVVPERTTGLADGLTHKRLGRNKIRLEKELDEKCEQLDKEVYTYDNLLQKSRSMNRTLDDVRDKLRDILR
eukprot:TRINITY_DN4600_c0_g1_i2.p1 TRINITY_DN4600_c0_g1~~TRINITY_DN4600_c0_g1_i2.p1  ORF type:complete len:153 (-),score=37.44 TRINITY_DN4600_c0_g1_i2:943-1401(-)